VVSALLVEFVGLGISTKVLLPKLSGALISMTLERLVVAEKSSVGGHCCELLRNRRDRGNGLIHAGQPSKGQSLAHNQTRKGPNK